MSEGATEVFEAEVEAVAGELSRWLGERTARHALEGFGEQFGDAEARRGVLARGQLAAFVEGEDRERANRAAELLELLASKAGEGPVVLWDRYEEGLERLRDEAVTGLAEHADDSPQGEAAWAAVLERRQARAVARQARAIRADMAAAGTRAILLLAGAWLLGIRFMTSLGWVNAALVVLATGIASSALHRMLLPREPRLPDSGRARFALVQPWLMTAALQGGLLYWTCGSARLSFWATILAVGFTFLSWPSSRVMKAWRSLGLSERDRVR